MRMREIYARAMGWEQEGEMLLVGGEDNEVVSLCFPVCELSLMRCGADADSSDIERDAGTRIRHDGLLLPPVPRLVNNCTSRKSFGTYAAYF